MESLAMLKCIAKKEKKPSLSADTGLTERRKGFVFEVWGQRERKRKREAS